MGEDLTLQIDRQGVDSAACIFTGTILVGTDIKQNVTIKTEELLAPLFLRAKFEISGIQNSGTIFGYTNWILKEDGYLYFNQSVGSNQKIGLCQYLSINKDIKLQSNINYVALFMVESSTVPWENNIQTV